MIINAINTSLSESELNTIKSQLNEVRSLMPFLVALTNKQRRAAFKMSSKRFDFVSKTIIACKTEPLIIPTWVNLEELERDYDLSNQLLGIENILEGLLQDVKDTRMQMGSEALKSAADVYALIQKSKDRIPGVQALFETLRESYPGRGKNKKKDEEQSDTQSK